MVACLTALHHATRWLGIQFLTPGTGAGIVCRQRRIDWKKTVALLGRMFMTCSEGLRGCKGLQFLLNGAFTIFFKFDSHSFCIQNSQQ